MKYIRNNNYYFERLGDKGVLVPLTEVSTSKVKLFELNEMGMLIWDMLIDEMKIEDIIRNIYNDINNKIDYGIMYADIEEFTLSMVQKGLLFEII